MKALRYIASVLLAAVSLAAAAAAVYLCLHFVDAKPILLTPPDVARSKVIMLMNAVSEGDYEEASQSIYGTPNLGVDREAADEVGVMIWDAFRNSITYELQGDCYTTEQGLAQNVSITCMDVTSVTVNLKERSQTLLEQRVEEAVDVSEIYDENNEYREDFVMAVLQDAVEDALVEDAQMMTMELTMNLVHENSQWWVVMDSALLEAISGGVMK
jgi:hypothetical protein